MTDKEYIDNLTIWCTYHKDNLIDEYNLNYIPSYIKLFNTNNLNINGEHINHLGPHLNEICTYYYVWKNQIYSKYVGFCHYRRFYSDLGKEHIENFGIHYYDICAYNLKHDICGYARKIFKFNELFDYLKGLNIFDEFKLYTYIYDPKFIVNIPWKISYIFEWNTFNKICNIYFGFLEYIFGDYTNIDIYKDVDRMYGWMSEVVLGVIIALIYDNKQLNSENYYNNHILITNYNGNKIGDIIKWFTKNNRPTVKLIVVSNNDDIINEVNTDYIDFVYATNDINNVDEYHQASENIIELQINEYIKCLDPIEFRKGNYTIEKI